VHAADPPFMSLAELVRARPPAVLPKCAEIPERAESPAPVAALTEELADTVVPVEPTSSRSDAAKASLRGAHDRRANIREAGVAAVRDARLFRAALADAFEMLAARLTGELAREVLGRELHLGSADVAALARTLIAERSADGPVRLRVAPSDADIVCDLPVVADPRLGAGDAILECRSGEIDARLDVRLATILARLDR
jgi:hypothetical protein